MKIKKIHINNFRKFDDNTLFLGKRVTCIAGHNAVGKSTILGIISNSTEFAKSIGSTVDDKAFKADVKEIIKFSNEYDTSGSNKFFIHLDDAPQTDEYDSIIPFRATWQQEKTRYRLIPMKTEKRKTEKKIDWPTIYLGLSRLYPIGEVVDEDINQLALSSLTHEDILFLNDNHKLILSSSEDYKSSISIEVQNTKKTGFGIETDLYGALSNSAGQDNLGQILKALLSFKKLKDSMGADWIGGLLLIDEIDATLHPVAQNKLVDFLFNFSHQIGIQILFTTHSLSLLDHIHKTYIQNKNQFANPQTDTIYSFELAYISNGNGDVVINRNPDIDSIKLDLLNQYRGSITSRIYVYSEDEEARWMFDNIYSYLKKNRFITQDPNELKHVSVSLGKMQLLKLLIGDFEYFSKTIFLLDGDVTESEINSEIQTKIPLAYSESQNSKILLKLPGNDSPEKVLWTYSQKIDENHLFYQNTGGFEFNKRSFCASGPTSSIYNHLNTDREKYKYWFNDNLYYMNTLIEFWIADNLEEVKSFLSKLKFSHDYAAQQNSIPSKMIINI